MPFKVLKCLIKNIYISPGVKETHVICFDPRQLLICAPIPWIAPVGDVDWDTACHLDHSSGHESSIQFGISSQLKLSYAGSNFSALLAVLLISFLHFMLRCLSGSKNTGYPGNPASTATQQSQQTSPILRSGICNTVAYNT